MKFFTLGPVQMAPDVLRRGAEQPPYFRTASWSLWMLQMEAKMKQILQAEEGSRVVMLSSSGTGGMEAALTSCFHKDQDKILILSAGTFGDRFAQIAKAHQIPHVVHPIDEAHALTHENLAPYAHEGFTGITVTHCETSHGKLTDLSLVSRFAKEHGLLSVVDAVSSFICEPLDMSRLKIDVVITASQKALACAPGIAPIALSSRAIDRITELSQKRGITSFYLDLAAALKNLERGQTPFTPSLSVLHQIDHRLSQLVTSIEDEREHMRQCRAAFQNAIGEWDLTIPSWSCSNALTLLESEDVDMMMVFQDLQEYAIFVTPCGGEVAQTRLRVGHMGALTSEDYDDLVEHLAVYFRREK